MQKAINKFEHAPTQQRWSGDCSSSHVEGTNSLQIFIVINLEKHKEACNIWEYMKRILFILDALAMPHKADGQHVYSEKESGKLIDTFLGLFLI